MAFACAGVLAAGAAAAALAIATLTPDHDNQPPGRPLSDQRSTTQDLEGSADDSAGSTGSGPACLWTSEVNTPVLPAEDLGGPSAPESVLTFEKCGGDWTGRMAWLNPGSPHAGRTCRDQVPVAEAGGGDSGFVNPWAAGNAAVARYLCELGREP
ncbi:MAG: hypothetical protein ACRDZ0_14470 [Acidimicrobiales bacterium]